MSFVLELRYVAKSFTLHLQGGMQLSIVSGVTFSVRAGECVVLSGPSGAGKSSILKMVFGNYRCDRGQILVRQDGQTFDIATTTPRCMLALRRSNDEGLRNAIADSVLDVTQFAAMVALGGAI
jgi:alpha-D-ribose 1-methylphosphonate 5-triphosphate synthase subunit PhnL